MKNIKKILLLGIFVSSFHIVSNYTKIQFSDLLPTIYAETNHDLYSWDGLRLEDIFVDQKLDRYAWAMRINSSSIMLKHKNEASISIMEGTELRINKKFKTYYFSSYDDRENKILLKNKKSKIIAIDLSDIQTISLRLNDVKKNIFTGLLGGAIGGYLGMIPSMMTGCIVGMTFFPGHQDYGMSRAGMIVSQGITVLGAIKSAQYGYAKGANLENPFIHFYLTGHNSWEINMPEINSQDVN